MANKIPKEFIEKIKENKKYASISDGIVIKEIERYMKRYQADQEEIYDDKFAIKVIRKELHRLYSSYQTKGKKKRDEILEKLKEDSNNLETINEILSTTLATKERIPNYQTIFQRIFKITKDPKSIIDLGCGLNPISIPYMKLKNIEYNAYDIDEDDIKFLNEFFKIIKIKGRAKILDARELEELKALPNSDIIFMFKLYDLIVPKQKKQKKLGEEIINLLMTKTKYLVVSFATKTLTRKSMKLPRRIGFEMMLDRNQLAYELIETDNEIYYIINKKN